MNKKILLISLTMLSTTTMAVGAITIFGDAFKNGNINNQIKANSNYTLTLDKSNQLDTDDGDKFYSLTTSGNKVFFYWDDTIERNPTNGWVSLTSGGTFYNPYIFNTSKIKGMKSIKIDSDYNNLKLHYGCEVDGEIVYSNYVEFDTENINYTFVEGHEPSYIKIEGYVGSGPNLLEDVIIEYSCSESSETPTENLAYELIEGKNEYRITGFTNYKEDIPDDLVIPSIINEKPVTEIGNDAFNGPAKFTLYGFKSITIPDSVKYIGARAFKNCQAVTKINMPTEGIEIGDDAFLYCGDMETINITATQTEIDLDAYRASPVLTTINVEEGNPNFYSVDGVLYAYSYSDSHVSNKNTLLYCPCAKEGTITIPDQVEYIAEDAFRNSKASTIHIGNNINSISEDFKTVTSLTTFEVGSGNTYYSVRNDILCYLSNAIAYPRGNSNDYLTIPNTISKINDHVFDGINNLEVINILGNTVIGEGSFANMTNLETISLSSVGDIGAGAFKNDISLVHANLNDSYLTTIPNEAFMNCSSLSFTYRSLPDSILTIGERSFKNCSSLVLDTLPIKLVSIGAEAFMNCTSYSVDLVIPNTVISIGNAAFRHTPITNFTLSTNMDSIPNELFYDCDSLTKITIPSHIKDVHEKAFYDCDSVYRIDIEDGVETIWHQAFEGCHAEYQFIPTSVTTIYGFAFHFTGYVRIYTPYGFTKYAGQGKNGLPSTWSVYFSGYDYDTVESVCIINGGYSRSQFMNERGWK